MFKKVSLKKFSLSMALVMMISLALPVLAFAADKVLLYLDKSTGTVTGSVYYDVYNGDNMSVTENVYLVDSEGNRYSVDNLVIEGKGEYYTVSGNVYSDITVTKDVYFTFNDADGVNNVYHNGNVSGSVYEFVYGEDNGGSTPPPSSGGGGWYGGGGSTSQDGVKELSNSQLKAADGVVTITLSADDKQVLFPANANAISADNVFVFEREGFKVEIPGALLVQLQKQIDSSDLNKAKISFSFDKLTEEKIAEILKGLNNSSTAVTAAGEVYDFDLAIVNGSEEKRLSSFDPSIKVDLAVTEEVDADLTNLYYVDDASVIEYVYGGDVDHFSYYGNFEYDKTFSDVPAGNWAEDVIKQLAAKQVAYGISETEFAPTRQVTRAEFTAFLVRAMGLESDQAAPFSDVVKGSWYEEAVNAAYASGIVSGVGNNKFAPNAKITRQEMAVMLIKAYELKTGESVAAEGSLNFVDATQVADWAKDYVSAASSLGLLVGQGNNVFNPTAYTTRAESTQVASLLVR
ncbi:S-layer homology domain-containing protein [Marinicrinis lubricantis]|uniref:S-layer homology domain-containing protein n=1 Tax=Marinicrinis lubricantis TaxID=2086470 RepID=A0ABW1IKF4_9BACL